MRTDKVTYGAYCNLLPSAALSVSLCQLFKNSYPKVFSLFGESILPFKQVDLSSAAIPALLIYPSQSRIVSESWYMKTSLFMDFIYPGGAMVRQRSTEIATVMAEAVIYTILKNDNILDFLKFGLPDHLGLPTWGKFPGLVELGENIEADFSDQNSLNSKQDSVLMRMRVSYTIDTVQWWQYIQEVLGNNVFDPCIYLYPLIEDYILDVTLKSSLNT